MAGVDRSTREPERPGLVIWSLDVISDQRPTGNHNRRSAKPGVGGGRSSDEAANPRGAKGPCQIHVFIRSEEIRLDTRPTTEEHGGLTLGPTTG